MFKVKTTSVGVFLFVVFLQLCFLGGLLTALSYGVYKFCYPFYLDYHCQKCMEYKEVLPKRFEQSCGDFSSVCK